MPSHKNKLALFSVLLNSSLMINADFALVMVENFPIANVSCYSSRLLGFGLYVTDKFG